MSAIKELREKITMTHHRFLFDFQKSVETAGLFLRLAGGRLRFIELLKLMYMADRQCLAEEARTITGDAVYALPHGPVLSTVYKFIKGKGYQVSLWQRYIKTDGRTVFIANDPGTGELCRFEKAIIENVYQENKDRDVVRISHTFPEWKKYESLLCDPNTPNSYEITIGDVLEGLAKTELMPIVEERIAEIKDYKKLFGR